MRGGRYNVTIFERIVQQAFGDQTGRMSHIVHQDCTYFIGDFTHPFIIPVTGISGTTANDQFRFLTKGYFLHLVVVHPSGIFLYIIFGSVIENAGAIYW